MYLLGYDIGSSSVKASLVNAVTGKCVASAFYPKTEAAIIAVKQGWAEQEPANWWENLKLSTKAIMAESGVKADDIKAIGISYRMISRLLVFLIRCTDLCVLIKIRMFFVLQLSGVIQELFHTDRRLFRLWEKKNVCLIC